MSIDPNAVKTRISQTLHILGGSEPSFDPAFRGVHRIDLGAGAWVDRLPG